MGAKANKTFSSHYIQENHLNIVLGLLQPVLGTPLEKYGTILSVILVIPKAVIQN